jgi:hypothetical protein
MATQNHTAESRQEQLRRLDTWLSQLHAEHPVYFNLLVAALSAVVLSFAMLIKRFLSGGTL